MKVPPFQAICPGAFAVAGSSDIGCVRKENQDAWLVDESLGLVVVADGMGGGPAGAQAAQAVAGRLPELLRKGLNGRNASPRRPRTAQRSDPAGMRCREARRLLRETVLALSREILRASEDDPERKGMGATVVAAWRCGTVVHVVHQGDSRAYLFRGGVLNKLTADHSIVALLMRNGEITEKEATKHPARGQLTRFVGMPGDVYCEVQTLKIEDGDRLLLCTDGLWGIVNDDEIAAVLASHAELERGCGELIELAKRRGAPDNVTALVWNVGL
ncbi:MAG: protein phosphatase 2C domain-containing protein [bacterium]|nr:protein phosphatase 2C domain-containing protein [bacterium]MDD4460174.1 protein phosphatase 2C domain-containing protein [Proteiniphilum sp.]